MAGIVATGGTITTDGAYTIHTFTSSGTFQVTSGSGNVWYLVVAGGGAAGGRYGGGGGGAGGLRTNATYDYAVTVNSYTVTVGAGGPTAGNGEGTVAATNGSDSVFDTITSVGGGAAGTYPLNTEPPDKDGSVGGSGGGGATASNVAAGTGAAGTASQGSAGGNGSANQNTGGGGGGGAGGVGADGTPAAGGAAGAGVSNSISGAAVTYAAGGAGGFDGTSGGGNGSVNTGNGGNGAGNFTAGGLGGSGVVIVRYATATIDPPVADFTGTPTSGTVPLTVQFTDSSTNTPTSWAWTFGDAGTSTAQNPSHDYSSAGTYSVGLTATNAGGSDLETKTDYITVDAVPVAASTTQEGGGGYNPSQGYSGHESRRKTPEDVRLARERVGIITPKAESVIHAVAARQVNTLEQDEQKYFEELARELELEGIAWEAQYLDALAQQREMMIQQEIATLLQRKLNNEALMSLVLLAAA